MIKGRMIMIIITSVLIVVGLVSMSLSWYVSQEQVRAEDAAVVAEESLSTSIYSVLVEDSKYGGETGKAPSSHEDAPYSVRFNVSLSASAIQEVTHLKILLKKLTIMTGLIEESGNILIESNTPDDNMTIRVEVGNDSYLLNGQGYLVKENDNSEFYLVQNGENELVVEIIYLDESRYLQWIEDNADSLLEYNSLGNPGMSYFNWLQTQPQYFAYDPCEYSLPLYMYTHFYLAIEYITDTIIGG